MLTPQRRRVLKLICDGQDANGYAPTLQEIADAMKRKKPTVHEMVYALQEMGFVRHDRSVRGSSITDAGREALARNRCPHCKLPLAGFALQDAPALVLPKT